MIIVMKPNAPQASIENVIRIIESKGLETHLSIGKRSNDYWSSWETKVSFKQKILRLQPDVDKICTCN